MVPNTAFRATAFDFKATKKFADPQRLKRKLEEHQIPQSCAEVVENGLYCYMERVVNEVFQVFQMMRNNDDTFRKKVYNFYNKNKRGAKHLQNTDYKNVALSDPLGEYKHFEKTDLQEQKLFENKIQNKESKPEEVSSKKASKD